MDRISKKDFKGLLDRIRVVEVVDKGRIEKPDDCLFNISCTICALGSSRGIKRSIYDEDLDVFYEYDTSACLPEGVEVYMTMKCGVPKAEAIASSFERAVVDDANEDAFKKLKNFSKKNAVIIGDKSESNQQAVGVGKTFMLVSLLKKMLPKKKCLYIRAVDLVEELRLEEKSKLLIPDEKTMFFVDDLGKEVRNEWNSKLVFSFVDLCDKSGASLAVTSNMYPEELEERYGEYGQPIVSRLFKNAEVVILKGKDRRLG